MSNNETNGAARFSGKVLVAEDNPSNQMLITLILKKLGFESTVADDGKIALDKIQQDDFDIVLMDMMMPNMNGYEATQAMRRQGIKLPIVAVTANAMKGDREKCLEAGCDEYVSKPITKEKLEETISLFITPNDSEQTADASLNNNDTSGDGPITSELADDPDLCIVAEMFVERLGDTLENIRSAYEGKDIASLKDTVHELKGAGGSAGYPVLTEKAAAMEQLVLSDKLDDFAAAFDELTQLCDRVVAPQKAKA